MDEREFIVLIKEIEGKVDYHYRESGPSTKIVFKCLQNFSSGHMSTGDTERSGRHIVAITLEIKSIIW